MRRCLTGAQGARFVDGSGKAFVLFLLILFISGFAAAQTTDQIPPTTPTGLVATAATCGQIDLSWNASSDDPGGSGVKAYVLTRSDGVNTTIGAARTTFSDTNYLRSAATFTYTVAAQ